MEYWNARATYDDGFEIDRNFTYSANGNYLKENEEQYDLENWLINSHDGCNWYSVTYVKED